jgi:hypothetical protein
MNGLLSPAEFQYDDESRGKAGIRWTCLIRDFQVFMTAANIKKGSTKKGNTTTRARQSCTRHILC